MSTKDHSVRLTTRVASRARMLMRRGPQPCDVLGLLLTNLSREQEDKLRAAWGE